VNTVMNLRVPWESRICFWQAEWQLFK
jgi:hypothetical protein